MTALRNVFSIVGLSIALSASAQAASSPEDTCRIEKEGQIARCGKYQLKAEEGLTFLEVSQGSIGYALVKARATAARMKDYHFGFGGEAGEVTIYWRPQSGWQGETPGFPAQYSWSPRGQRLVFSGSHGFILFDRHSFKEIARGRYEPGDIGAPLPEGHRLVSTRWKGELQLVFEVSSPKGNYWLRYSLDSLAWFKASVSQGPFKQIVTPLRKRFKTSARPRCRRSPNHKTLRCGKRTFTAPEGELVGAFQAGNMPYIVVRTYDADSFGEKDDFYPDGSPVIAKQGYLWGLKESKQRPASFVLGKGYGGFAGRVWSKNGRWAAFYDFSDGELKIFNQADLKNYLRTGVANRSFSLPQRQLPIAIIYNDPAFWDSPETIKFKGGCCGTTYLFRFSPFKHQWRLLAEYDGLRRR